MTVEAPHSFARFRAPRYWPIWLFWLLLRLTWHMPLRWQMRIGGAIGRLLERALSRDRGTALRNLEVCFPALGEREREALCAKFFDSLGKSFVEMGIGWFMPTDRLERIVEVHGVEHFEAAMAKGKGIILFTAHLTTIEIGLAMLERLTERAACMYRPQKNEMMNAIVLRGRSRFARRQIPRDDVKSLIRTLRDGFAVFYAPDQTYLGNQSAMLPFFGEPASTNIATSKLASITGASVLPYFFRRLEDESGYRIDIAPPLEGVPGDDPVEDSVRLFALLEDYIRLAPEQYLWTYRKFKRRPAGFADMYANRGGKTAG